MYLAPKPVAGLKCISVLFKGMFAGNFASIENTVQNLVRKTSKGVSTHWGGEMPHRAN